MDLSTVKKVVETNNVTQVNNHLDKGWILLSAAPGQWPDTKEPHIKYSIGWAQEGDPA